MPDRPFDVSTRICVSDEPKRRLPRFYWSTGTLDGTATIQGRALSRTRGRVRAHSEQFAQTSIQGTIHGFGSSMAHIGRPGRAHGRQVRSRLNLTHGRGNLHRWRPRVPDRISKNLDILRCSSPSRTGALSEGRENRKKLVPQLFDRWQRLCHE